MNRREEYQALMRELETTPPELGNTVQKALLRESALQKKTRRWRSSIAGFAAGFAVFVLLVNFMPPFAQACGRVPVLSALAEAVRFSPSLSAAVENDYVQPINLAETKNNITATVESVIVDRKQVSIFFTLSSDTYQKLDYRYHVDVPGETPGWNSTSASFGLENGELRQIDVNFVEIDVPGQLQLCLKVYENADTATPSSENSVYEDAEEQLPDILAEFTFTLEFSPYYTAQGEVVPVNHSFVLDGQTLTLTEVEIYPTHLRVNLDDAPENTAWLKGVELYLENERGERFESAVNGISATGDSDGEGYAAFWLDSPFFSRGEKLTLYLTGAEWLEKDAPQVRVDLSRGTVTGLSEEIMFLGAKRHGADWWVSFAAPKGKNEAMYQLFQGNFSDAQGVSHDIMRWSTTIGYQDTETGEIVEADTMFTQEFPLEGLEGEVAFLTPAFSCRSDLSAAPIGIAIR